MQNESKQEENEIVNIPELPPEMWMKILSYVPIKLVETKVKMVSKRLHEISHTYFIDSLYGRYLRFNKWHDNELKKLKKEVTDFSSRFELSTFNIYPQDTNENFLSNISFILTILVSIAFIAAFKRRAFNALINLSQNTLTSYLREQIKP